jgi:two-component sensor histidine kinase
VREPDGSISGIFVEGQDVTDHVLAEQRLELINRELQHRVKNTLATVQAIAMQTLRDVTDRGPVEALTQRILALSRAHDTLIQQNWSSADIADAARASIDNFGVSDRVDIEGPSLELGPNATLSLAMILHELSTNAMKYGALSVETGRVSLRWAVENTGPEAELVIRWTEEGGPPAIAPKGKSGFGTKLVKMGLDGTGHVKLDFLSTGLSAELRAPLASLHRT